jgi:hypothetical protein
MFAVTWAGCSQNAVTVPIRSLERSGKAAFLCIRDHGDAPGLPLDECHVVSPPVGTSEFQVHHAISLVTQTTRGEVAVVDVTASGVVDLDPSVPGFNFLPVGALPTDVVATPGSSAAFVAVADPNRSGIFGISTSHLFPEQTGNRGPTLASLPACGLPAAPSEMVLVRDLASGPGEPKRCDGSMGTPAPGYSLADETRLYGPLKLVVTLPELGQMVVIDAQDVLARTPGTFDLCPIENTLDLGSDIPLSSPESAAMVAGSASVASADGGDAAIQDQADAATQAESGASDQDASIAEGGADGGATGNVCSGRKGSTSKFGVTVHPASMTYADDGRIFVSDDEASAIHVVDARDPCHLSLLNPLLPISRTDPGRAVLTGPIAVSPLTTDLKRFVYAVDLKDNGSVMVFDVSEGSTDRTPLLRPDVKYNQIEPADRLAFGSAVQSLTFGTQEVPLAASEQVPRGLKCDPKTSIDPGDPSYPYRPPADFISTGAGPRTLRGMFAFLVLASAQMMIVDIDDYDGACRRPLETDDLRLGCGAADGTQLSDTQAKTAFPAASQEISCRVVERHRPRAAQYISNLDAAGRHAPAMQTFPLLRNKDGTVLSIDPTTEGALTRPKLLGPCLDVNPDKTVNPEGNANLLGAACTCSSSLDHQPPIEDTFLASVSGGTTTAADFCPVPYPVDRTKLAMQADPVAKRNWVAFDLHEPRAHIDQGWTITFEGIVSPWFNGRRGRLTCADASKTDLQECERGSDASHFTLLDSDAGFCDHGAQGADLATAQGLDAGVVPHFAGDIVQILDPLLDPADSYWASAKACSPALCEAQYGTPDKPVVASAEQIKARGLDPNQTWFRRDLLVTKSFQDRLELQASFAPSLTEDPQAAPLACCFPYPITYAVRGGSQWIVFGSRVGFEHRLIPDPTAKDSSIAACIVSCDPNLELRNGRAARRSLDAPIPPNSMGQPVFRNEALQFVVWDPAVLKCEGPCLQRDMAFSFQEVGGFGAMLVPLSSNSFVMPQAISFVPGLSQLAIPDATSQGLMLFDLRRIATTQTIF